MCSAGLVGIVQQVVLTAAATYVIYKNGIRWVYIQVACIWLMSARVLGGPEPADGADARDEAGGVRAIRAQRPLLGG